MHLNKFLLHVRLYLWLLLNRMNLNSVIFDMDGLLIDSEPLWNEAADEVFQFYGVQLTQQQYATTTGLRTKEFVQWWFTQFNLNKEDQSQAEKHIIQKVIQKVKTKGVVLPGVDYIFDFFKKKNFNIGLATSSPSELIEVVVDICGIRKSLQAICSAEFLDFGKPHPQVYLNCAEALHVLPTECICFEDSFNGAVSAKSARMKCVVVPHYNELKNEKWGVADLKLTSLQNFSELHFNLL